MLGSFQFMMPLLQRRARLESEFSGSDVLFGLFHACLKLDAGLSYVFSLGVATAYFLIRNGRLGEYSYSRTNPLQKFSFSYPKLRISIENQIQKFFCGKIGLK